MEHMMKKVSRMGIFLLLALAAAAPGRAADLAGKTSLGVRLPFVIPLFEGKNFQYYEYPGQRPRNIQPFLLGWNFGLELKYGVSNRVMLGLTGNYFYTHDDSTTESDAGNQFHTSERARAKLSALAFGLNAYWYFLPEARLQPYLLGGAGIDHWTLTSTVNEDSSHNSTDLNLKIGAGLMVPLNDQFAVDLQARYSHNVVVVSEDFPIGFYGQDTWGSYDDRPFRSYLELTVGLACLFGGEPDTDGDGVKDSKDLCPGTPLGVVIDKAGCPLDGDADGVPDYLDQCPDTPAGVAVDDKGCPRDTDGDGVADYLDKCADTPAGFKVDADGCPLDADGDGVVDENDKCPDTPEGAPVDAAGCPLDSDKDGVFDYLDKCPGTPEAIPVDETGCPKLIKKGEKITLHINFPTNSFEIDEASKRTLDGVAQTMLSFPDIKIRAGGFTDNTGSTGHNQRLSENRAKAVTAYLESKGVPADRMSAKGFGEDPKYFVGDNATEEGKALNRRVELESVE